MQARLTLKDGTEISLSEDAYQKIMSIIKSDSVVEPAYSVKDLETEFAILFAEDGPSTNDLIEEHLSDRQRDERLLKSFS